MDLVKIIKVNCSNCILLGDFNTAIGIMDSAYAENDLDITGYLSVFRSMSDWLETLLSPEECFFLFVVHGQRRRMRDDRQLPRAPSLRAKRVQLLQHEAERPGQQLRNADRLHRVHASAARLFGGVCDSIGCDGERSFAGRGWFGCVWSSDEQSSFFR